MRNRWTYWRGQLGGVWRYRRCIVLRVAIFGNSKDCVLFAVLLPDPPGLLPGLQVQGRGNKGTNERPVG